MSFGLAFSIARRHLLARRRQSLLAMLGIVLGGAIFALMVALSAGQMEFLRAKLIDISPHIIVTSDRMQPAVSRNLLGKSDAVTELVTSTPPSARKELRPYSELLGKAEKASPLIVAVAPYVVAHGVFRNGMRHETVSVRGIEPEREKYIGRLKENIRSGNLEALRGTPNGTAIGRGLARKLDVAPGDDITFITPRGAIEQLRVVAIFESGIASFDDRLGYINLAFAQSIEQRSRNAVTGLSVQVRDPDRIDEVVNALQMATGYRAESWEESNAQLLDFQQRQRLTTRILVAVVFVVAAFGISNTLIAIVLQKKLDIAIMKSIGISSRSIVLIFLIEGMIIGCVGGMLAAVLGYLLSDIVAQLDIFPADNPVGYLRFERVPVSLDLSIYLFTFVLSMLMATVASILPARRAAKFIPVQVIRGEV
jgi:lipoprotein-releasing system permease protein